jgi:hypothetical protein
MIHFGNHLHSQLLGFPPLICGVHQSRRQKHNNDR